MAITEQLAQKYQETLLGESQLGASLKKQLEHVDWETATRRWENYHTIATLTFHIGYYLQAVISVLQDKPLTLHDKRSFNHPPVQSEADWNALQETVWEHAERCVQLISAMPAERLEAPFSDPKYGSHYRNLTGILEHATYHMGQLAWLKKHWKDTHADQASDPAEANNPA